MSERSPEPVNDPNLDPALARKNILWGLAIFGLFVLLFAGTVVVAFIYLWVGGG